MLEQKQSKIVIAGAGPAGTSAAIRLARQGFSVTLVERERFPRHKLCGEFISPECLLHFQQLGVLEKMQSAGGDEILETVFYAPNGKSVAVPSEWFANGASGALSLSRSEMDFQLLQQAKNVGVEVLEETQVSDLIRQNNEIKGVIVKNKNGVTKEINTDLTIDATGRAAVLAKLAVRQQKPKTKDQKPKTKLIGFKAHLRNAKIEHGVCEIYFFRGGYGGLCWVENGVSNHCFLVEAKIVRELNNNAERVWREVVGQNRRALAAMQTAEIATDWLAVSVDGFGVKNLAPATNLLTIGDAAAFIDPFTGSGMLMALESGEVLAESIRQNSLNLKNTAKTYQRMHRQHFAGRLRVCSFLRRLAFMPKLAASVIYALNLSDSARKVLARATRPTVFSR
jgi:flavin-dependent dehydrogenase